ncbi:hypothetical protein R4518_00275 [Listeria monocytogenes]|nr:hypothetical protein R4518_00275 [Listeria monocytogenes]WOS29657.1 hypothetical protein R5O29_09755 [Listeria monocytogenes]
MSIIKKWWFWLICLLIIIGIGFTVWYTQVYTSEWGKGLSKEEKAVFEYAKETSNKSFDISSIDNKELDKLYSLLMDSGTYNKTIILDQNNLKNTLTKHMTSPANLRTFKKTLIYIKKSLIRKEI